MISKNHEKLLDDSMTVQSTYAAIDDKNRTVYLIKIIVSGQIEMKELKGFDAKPLAVYEDAL